MEYPIWNNTNDLMPEKDKWVIVHTPFCKYLFCSALFNGGNWIDSERTIIYNVQHWTTLKEPV